MVPYIEISPVTLGGIIVIEPFGLLVIIGCAAGFIAARWYGNIRGLERKYFVALTTWTLVPAFILAHVISLLIYFPEIIDQLDPSALLKIGTAMSSFGGFLGGSIGAIFYLKRNSLSLLEYGDSLVFGLTIGWFFGRLGCTIAHDHPGKFSNFILAVQYPDGTRHDLGFYKWIFTIVLIMILLFLQRRQYPAGIVISVVCILYAPVRFLFDFLRVGDKLYWGLTPGQYAAAFLLLLGLGILVLVQKKPFWQGRSLSSSGGSGPDTV